MDSIQSRQATDARTVGGEYELRWCRPGDAAAVHELLTAELNRSGSRKWFDWKYTEDPYLSHIPINVVEHEGELVGMQAYVPTELRSGTRTVLALQPVDAFIHPSHRRNGLYTELTRQGVERYTAGEPSMFFNYPNPGALGAQKKLGWEKLGDLAVYYRVQRPSAIVEKGFDGVAGRVLDGAADAVARSGLAVLDATRSVGDEIEVTRHDEPPVETLASLYERHVPDRLHVHREQRYYEWWLDDPLPEFETYVARAGDEPVGAIVTRKAKPQVLQLKDAVPLAPDQSRPAFEALLTAVLRDNDDVAVVKSVGATLPGELLRRFGFVRDAAPLVNSVTTPIHMAARPLVVDSSDDVRSETVTDRSNWHPTFIEVDRD